MKPPKRYTKAFLAELLPQYCRGKTVDVGAGHAKYRDLIRPFTTTYTTVDDMSSGYEFGGSMFAPDVVSDVLHMPFSDGEFDTAICTEVFEHVEDPFALIAEIARILKPGGYLIVSSPWASPYHREPKDYWRFSADAYWLLAERSGLQVVEIRKKGGLASLLLYFANRNIDLNTKVLKAIKRRLSPLVMIVEKIVEKLDGLVESEDTIGHVVVARKRLRGVE